MNYFKSIMLTAFALFALAACDTDDLRDDVDNLKDRVESLEAQVSLLNDNMTAIKRLLEGGQTITEVTNTDGTYKLKLSNGETISLTQGSKGEVAYPEITVNDEGQWVVNGEVLMQNAMTIRMQKRKRQLIPLSRIPAGSADLMSRKRTERLR